LRLVLTRFSFRVCDFAYFDVEHRPSYVIAFGWDATRVSGMVSTSTGWHIDLDSCCNFEKFVSFGRVLELCPQYVHSISLYHKVDLSRTDAMLRSELTSILAVDRECHLCHAVFLRKPESSIDSLGQLNATHHDACPDRSTRAHLEAALLDHFWRTKHVLERYLGASSLFCFVHQRDFEVTWVCDHVCCQRDLECLIERGAEDVCTGSVGFGRCLERFVTPGDLDAGVELIALTGQAEGASNQYRRKTANISWGTAVLRR